MSVFNAVKLILIYTRGKLTSSGQLDAIAQKKDLARKEFSLFSDEKYAFLSKLYDPAKPRVAPEDIFMIPGKKDCHQSTF